MKYQATAPITFNAGAVLGLTKDQASSRRPVIVPVQNKKDMYELIGPTQFKAGEILYFDGELPKHLAESVEKQGKSKGSQQSAPKITKSSDQEGTADQAGASRASDCLSADAGGNGVDGSRNDNDE